MARRQTRRSISMTGLTYQRFMAWCKDNDMSGSGQLEVLLTKFLDAEGQPEEKILRVQYPKPRRLNAEQAAEQAEQHFTF